MIGARLIQKNPKTSDNGKKQRDLKEDKSKKPDKKKQGASGDDAKSPKQGADAPSDDAENGFFDNVRSFFASDGAPEDGETKSASGSESRPNSSADGKQEKAKKPDKKKQGASGDDAK